MICLEISHRGARNRFQPVAVHQTYVYNLLKNMNLRHTTQDDGINLWKCVQECPPLELNSCYAYILICTDFSGSCVVAEDERGIAGFILGYRPPSRPTAAFVWQIGVHPRARGQALGYRMLEFLASSGGDARPEFIEATVAPSNNTSRHMFERFAARMNAPCHVSPKFERQLFGNGDHEEEQEIRIGPIRE